VIVGRGAQCILQDREDVFRAFVYGPWRERAVRVCRRPISASDAERSIRSADDERAHYIKTYFGRDWKDPALYHLMISSGNGLDHAARMIVAGVLANVADAEGRHATSAH
jgi:cytidylate kinase